MIAFNFSETLRVLIYIAYMLKTRLFFVNLSKVACFLDI
jgi:hypothetical protein